jgi:site-specific DNA recombinase
MERERARQRTYDAMLRKAKALHVTGGRVYGYDNVETASIEGKRSHVVRRINPAQAEVVRRIFQLYADGLGLTKVAKKLNVERVLPPRQDARGWAGTAVREMLRRELYRGVVVWNRSQKIVRGGTARQRKRSEDQWLHIEAPELRIVPQQLWTAVQLRLEHAATAFPRSQQGGKLMGGPARHDGDSPYLLTGFTACSVCGGAIGGATQYHGTGPLERRKRVTFYICTTRRKRGDCICSNDVVMRTGPVDAAVISTITDVLDSRVIERAIERAFVRYQVGQGQQISRRDEVKRELDAVEIRLGRLVEALGSKRQVRSAGYGIGRV